MAEQLVANDIGDILDPDTISASAGTDLSSLTTTLVFNRSTSSGV